MSSSSPENKRRRGAGALALAAMSGLCGLGYEVALIGALQTVLGHTVAVSAAVIASFLLMLALGAAFGRRLQRRLAWVELAAAALAAGLAAATAYGLGGWAALLGGAGPLEAVLLAVALSAPTAFLAGVAVPAYALRVGHAAGQARSRAFSAVYLGYNALAAAAVAATALWAIPAFGLTAVFAALAAANLVVALGVAVLEAPGPDAPVMARAAPPDRREAAFVALAGLGGGVLQVAAVKLANFWFGPASGNAAIAMTLALAGLSIGAFAQRRPSERAFVGAVAAACVCMAVTGQAIGAWPDLLAAADGAVAAHGAKIALLAFVLGPAFVAFGMTVPLVVGRRPGDAGTPGMLLAIAATANAVGALAAVTGLNATFGLAGMIVVVLLSLAAASACVASAARGAVLAALACAVFLAWPERDLSRSAKTLADPARAASRELVDVETFRAFDRTAHVLRYADGSRRLVLDGHGALSVEPDGLRPSETLVGLIAARLAPAHERALVLGLGTGTTAAAVAGTFGETLVVDSDPLAPRIAGTFARANLGLMERGHWRLVRADGISVLNASGPGYDAIVSTVDSGAFAPAAKLYAMESLRAAARRLKPGGVFVMWVDVSTPEAGREMLGAALRRAFSACLRYQLDHGYVALACGVEGPPRASAAMPSSRELSDLLDRPGAAASRGLAERVDAAYAGVLPLGLFEGMPARLDPPRFEALMSDPRRLLGSRLSHPADPFFPAAPFRFGGQPTIQD